MSATVEFNFIGDSSYSELLHNLRLGYACFDILPSLIRSTEYSGGAIHLAAKAYYGGSLLVVEGKTDNWTLAEARSPHAVLLVTNNYLIVLTRTARKLIYISCILFTTIVA
ncbi:MAG: hypothetical protein KME06_11940 [Kastovskya adunca ATA6-11-RM4]|nr:hypothetical protein [Kastovskya adunca ATA6-11-RM4]